MILVDLVMIAAMGAVWFFLGLILVIVLELFAVGSWVIGGLILAVMAAFILFETVTDRVQAAIFNRIFQPPATAETDAHDRRIAAASRHAGALGVVLAFAVTRVWTVSDIMELF